MLYSVRDLERQSDRLVDGANMVWKHVSKFRPSGELSSSIRTDLDDMLCGAVKYAFADQYVMWLQGFNPTLTRPQS